MNKERGEQSQHPTLCSQLHLKPLLHVLAPFLDGETEACQVESQAGGGSAGKCWPWDPLPGTLALRPLPGKGEEEREPGGAGPGCSPCEELRHTRRGRCVDAWREKKNWMGFSCQSDDPQKLGLQMLARVGRNVENCCQGLSKSQKLLQGTS